MTDDVDLEEIKDAEEQPPADPEGKFPAATDELPDPDAEETGTDG